MDSVVCFANDLSSGQYYPALEQLGQGMYSKHQTDLPMLCYKVAK